MVIDSMIDWLMIQFFDQILLHGLSRSSNNHLTSFNELFDYLSHRNIYYKFLSKTKPKIVVVTKTKTCSREVEMIPGRKSHSKPKVSFGKLSVICSNKESNAHTLSVQI